MTQVLIDRATLELVLRTLNRLRYDNDSAMAEEGFHEAAEALRAALANAEQQVPQWLPIETAPQNEKVLLACDGGIVIGMWRHYRIHNAPKFTHWMPLPTPPKEAL